MTLPSLVSPGKLAFLGDGSFIPGKQIFWRAGSPARFRLSRLCRLTIAPPPGHHGRHRRRLPIANRQPTGTGCRKACFPRDCERWGAVRLAAEP